MRQNVIREKATMLEAERSPAPIEGAGKIIIEMLLPYLCDNNISHVESTIFNSDPNRPIRRIRSLETKLGELYYLGDGHIYMYFLVKNACIQEYYSISFHSEDIKLISTFSDDKGQLVKSDLKAQSAIARIASERLKLLQLYINSANFTVN